MAQKIILFGTIIAVIIIVGVFLVKRQSESADGDTSVHSRVVEMSAAEFAKIIKEDDVTVVDVHPPFENYIAGTDLFLPPDNIAQNIDKLSQDKNTKLAVYCRSGNMSRSAVNQLTELGYNNIYHLTDGMNGWKSVGYELLAK
jgi:rhodanese-related sulfurtransferase